MPQVIDLPPAIRKLVASPEPRGFFAAIHDPDTGHGRRMLSRIAEKIAHTRRPDAKSDIPAGAAWLLQFAMQDLEFATRDGGAGRGRLDLGPVYGEAPRQDPLLAPMQGLWTLMHDAVASTLAESRSAETAFEQARRINRGIYREAIRRDVLGSWLMPRFRDRYAGDARPRAEGPLCRAPLEFMAGVGRLGLGLVREILAPNDDMEAAWPRELARQAGGARRHDMPGADWLAGFSRFFAIGSSIPQRARALGTHVGRPFATGMGAGTDASADGLVLRDLVACSRGGLRSVGSLISRAARAEPRLFEGCFARDETIWHTAVADWLSDTGLDASEIDRLAADPPLVLFLMLEAEADAGGRSLGALGSVLMGETLTAALPEPDASAETEAARREVFGGPVPASVAEAVGFLRGRPGNTRRLASEVAPARARKAYPVFGDTIMLDFRAVTKPPIARIEVADYIEMGRIVAQWATEPESRPADVAELRRQLEGIAAVPERVRTIEFAESTLDHLVLRLPPKEMIEEGLERMSDPTADGRYPLPQFYADHCRPGFGPVMTPLDTFLARVGDTSIAQCR